MARLRVFSSLDLSAQGFTTNVVEDVVWTGGQGWLLISSMSTSGPGIDISVTESVYDISAPVTGLPASVTSAGTYPFWAPKGALFTFRLQVSPGNTVHISQVSLIDGLGS